MYGYKPVRAVKRSELKRYSKCCRRKHARQCKLFTSFNDLEQVLKEIKKKVRTFSWSIMYLNKWKHFRREFLLFLNLKSLFWLPPASRYTGPPNGLDTSTLGPAVFEEWNINIFSFAEYILFNLDKGFYKWMNNGWRSTKCVK